MRILFYVLISLGAAVLIAAVCFICSKRAAASRDIRKNAFDLTKAFGNADIECVRVERDDEGKRYLVYYLMEKGAQSDYSKRLNEIYTKKVGIRSKGRRSDKIVRKIVSQMPYSLSIIQTDKTESDFFIEREYDKTRKEEEGSNGYDKEKVDDIKRFLSGKKLRLICHEEIDERSKLITDYYYFLYVFSDPAPGVETYYYLFQCSKENKKLGDERANDLISQIDLPIPFESSRITYSDLFAAEQNKIHGIWQLPDDYSE